MAGPLPTLQFVARPGILDLSWGHPAGDALPVTAWLEATERTLTIDGSRALAYGYAAGPAALREWLAARIGAAEPRPCDPAGVFVTAGASHALEILAAELMRRDDVVIVDAPTYHLALRILADAGVSLVHAPTDSVGLEPAATAALVAELRAAGRTVEFLYLVPTFANPTGASLPDDRRAALVEVARHLGLTIIEDDTYREFAYDGPAPPSLWGLADEGTVIRIGSFAKAVAPGLRLGWLNASNDIVDRLGRRGYLDSGGGVNHLVAMTMAHFGESGAFDRHLAVVRRRYADQRDALVGALPPSLPVAAPAGGWFLWVALPTEVSATPLLAEAERHGVSFVAGSRFYIDGRGEDHIRLSFSMLRADELTEAARRLAAALSATIRAAP
jgi:2-aminoadipate transaminase